MFFFFFYKVVMPVTNYSIYPSWYNLVLGLFYATLLIEGNKIKQDQTFLFKCNKYQLCAKRTTFGFRALIVSKIVTIWTWSCFEGLNYMALKKWWFQKKAH